MEAVILLIIAVIIYVIAARPTLQKMQFEQEYGEKLLAAAEKEKILQIGEVSIGFNSNTEEVIFVNWFLDTYHPIIRAPTGELIYEDVPKTRRSSIVRKSSDIKCFEIRKSCIDEKNKCHISVQFAKRPDDYFYTKSVSANIDTLGFDKLTAYIAQNLASVRVFNSYSQPVN